VLAVDIDPRALRRAERDVEDGAVLGEVDVLAGEHRVAPLCDAALLGESKQQAERLVRDAVLGVVEEDPLRLGGQAFPARGIGREQVAQVAGAHLSGVFLEGAPGRRLVEVRRGRRCHAFGPPQRVAVRAPALRRMFWRRSSHDLTNASAPSCWRRRASPSTSTPAAANRATTASASPPSAGRKSPTVPWSPKARSVFSGSVLTVKGAASART